MENIIWLIVTVSAGIMFTGLGVYAWKREKPMWFWSGSEVREKEISDVRAYNRANGIMWICYSAVFWISAVLGFLSVAAAGVFLAVGCLGGIPVLIVVYGKIYSKYRVN